MDIIFLRVFLPARKPGREAKAGGMSIKIAARPLIIFSFVFAIFSSAFAAEPLPPVLTNPKPATAKIEFMPLEQVRAGMRGIALTVFEGVKPEAMQLEVLGVEKNATGPRGDLILVRLLGSKPEYTGVVAGMSGSPVYIDGKLVGALAFRIGEFSKEPIAGITPIAEMMEINDLDQSRVPDDAASPSASPKADVASRTASPGDSSLTAGASMTQLLHPIETPLVFSGFTQDAVQAFGPRFAAAGIVPVMGAGSVSDEKQPEPIEPGSSVSMVLVQGDLNIAATCTVTYIDADHLLACGHPVLQFGAVDIPMKKARVIATLPSPMNSFKLINTTEPIGAFVQDRHSGILGRFGAQPDMIPVTLSVHGGQQPREYHYQVLNNPRLGPTAIIATVFSALQSLNEYGAENSYRVNGKISVDGYPDIALQNIFAPADGGAAPAMNAATMLGDRFNRLFANPYVRPKINGVKLEFDSVNDRRSARLETARTDVTEARPGDEIVVEAVLRPYRGERLVRQVPVKIPTSAPHGPLRILVSDGDTLDRMRHVNDVASLKLDLGSTISLLNKEHANNQLYVSMLEANPQATIEDKVMPTLPASIMNVMDGMRGTQDMVVAGESSVSEASLPLDYAVTGAQVISVDVK